MNTSARFCRTCGAQIAWLKNDKTSNVAPIDTVPVPDGPITINTGTDGYEVVSYHVLTKVERATIDPATPRYTNHWQTCRFPPTKKGSQYRP